MFDHKKKKTKTKKFNLNCDDTCGKLIIFYYACFYLYFTLYIYIKEILPLSLN